MKQEVAVKWVEALRSGKYTQTKNVLYDGHGYCVVWASFVIFLDINLPAMMKVDIPQLMENIKHFHLLFKN